MKILLSLILCSGVAVECMPPYDWPTTYPDMYQCMLAGYQESINKMIEIGRTDVNQYDMYVKFTCAPMQTT
jgi:hypothetical protein|tara:strand:- start:1025 stop:1237 length:213 start_codon:yes stop_codon:yes gene_type:complete